MPMPHPRLLLWLVVLLYLWRETTPMAIVVAGGGVMGASVAYYLAKEYNTPVTLVDPVGIAPGASGKAGGFLARDWRDGTPLQELHRLGFDLHQELADDLENQGNNTDYRRLTCAAVAIDEGKALNKPPSKKLRDVEWVDRGVVGSVSMGTEDNIAQVHPKKLCEAMFEYAAREAGSKLEIGRVVRATVEEDNEEKGRLVVKGVELEDGRRLPATQLVVACGPWTSEAQSWFENGPIDNRIQSTLAGITGVKCHSILVKSPNRVLNQAVFFESDGAIGDGDLEVYPRPDGDCYVNGFCGEEVLMSESPGQEVVEDDAIQLLIEAMKQTTSELGCLQPHTKQVCFWPETPDGLPLIGPIPGVSGGFLAAGHSVWGILQGPATGKAMAELLVEGKSSCIDLAPFRIDRSVRQDDEFSSVFGVRGGAVLSLTTFTDDKNVFDDIRVAMEISKGAGANIEAAEMACLQWEKILPKDGDVPRPVPSHILSICRTLYASCLVRVGRDADAIRVYDDCLSTGDADSPGNQRVKWRTGKAQCLQRLLEYNKATDEYLQIVEDGSHEEAMDGFCGAALCALRMGNSSRAIQICSDGSKATAPIAGTGLVPSQKMLLLNGLLACLQYLKHGDADRTTPVLRDVLARWNEATRGDSLLTSSSFSTLWLYHWILGTMSLQNMSTENKRMLKLPPLIASLHERYLILIQINATPLDDFNLLYLDDKIELHKLMRQREDTLTFWPIGFVLPEQIAHVSGRISGETSLTTGLWISKSRAGYGSHGNRILTPEEVHDLSISSHDNGKNTESYLLQRLIEPPLLLHGRKFSLRVYVVYFSPEEVYISTQGLVKLASVPFTEQSGTEASAHLTNSGREFAMTQHGLGFLENELANTKASPGQNFDDVWKKIRHVAAEVLLNLTKLHQQIGEDGERRRREKWCIPKILGLDFVLNAHEQPWLVEVNRFPGLEPRDESDRSIKYQVVRDAWKKAFELSSLVQHHDDHPFGALLEQLPCSQQESSLERLMLDDARQAREKG